MRVFILLCAVALAGCVNDPVSTAGTNNPQVPVSLLFEHDGCKVYRFTDYGRERYFANCPQHTSITTGHSQVCGKGCTRYIPEDVQTSYGATPDAH